MSKFPLLNIYRMLAIIGAILLVIVGVITSIRAGTGDPYAQSFDLGVFIGTLIPFLGAAFGLGVVAEVIALLLEVVDHLEHIREVTDRQAARESSATPPKVTSGTPPRASNPTSAYESTVRVRAKTSTTIRSKPDHEAPSSSELASGQSLPIYGRTRDNAWLTISRQGTLWLDAADVDIIEGYLSNLSVVAPA